MAFFNTNGLPSFEAGAAKVMITPPLGVSMYGYFHDRRALSIKDDLYCHAVVIKGDGGSLALVSLDIGAICQPEVDKAKERIAAQAGIPASNVLLCATHTHTGPVISRTSFLPCCEEWLDALPGTIAETVLAASRSMGTALLVPGRTVAEDVGSNRLARQRDGSERFSRDGIGPAGPVDKELQALRICDLEGETLCVVVNFAQHADNIGGGSADFISADWPGQVGRGISQIYGPDVVTVFLNGCCGDLNMSLDHPSRRAPGRLPRNISMGRALAGLTIASTEQAEPLESNTIRAQLDYLDIPYYTRDQAFKAEVREARDKDGGDKTPLVVQDANWRHDGEIAHVPVQVLRCGPVMIVGLPGEVFTRWGLEIKHWSPAPFTFVVELANGYFQYIPTTDQAQRGAYGAKPILSRALEADGGRKLVDRAQVLMWRLWDA